MALEKITKTLKKGRDFLKKDWETTLERNPNIRLFHEGGKNLVREIHNTHMRGIDYRMNKKAPSFEDKAYSLFLWYVATMCLATSPINYTIGGAFNILNDKLSKI